MIKEIKFVKLAGKWFAVLPWYEGDVDDLQMVCGADLMLDAIACGDSIVTVLIATSPFRFKRPDQFILNLEEEDDSGGTYKAVGPAFDGLVWLCNVTKYVLGSFPSFIYIIRDGK